MALMSRSDERVEQRMWSFFVVRANERSVSRFGTCVERPWLGCRVGGWF